MLAACQITVFNLKQEHAQTYSAPALDVLDALQLVAADWQLKEITLLATMRDCYSRLSIGTMSDPQSVVHGDWKDKQLLAQQDRCCVLDFRKSFYRPSILDYAYYYDEDATNGLDTEVYSNSTLLKAKIVANILMIAWYLRCRENYINYDYQKNSPDLKTDITGLSTCYFCFVLCEVWRTTVTKAPTKSRIPVSIKRASPSPLPNILSSE